MNGACCTCEEVKRMMAEMEHRIIASGGGKGGGPRRKRRPSWYNMYIKECAAGGKNDLKSCAVSSKQLSDEEKKKYKEMAARAS